MACQEDSLKLPKVLQFFSGNIGLHHVHHLSARIPNYNLQRAHDENPIFHDVPTLSLMDGLRTVRHEPVAKRGRTAGLPTGEHLTEPGLAHGEVR